MGAGHFLNGGAGISLAEMWEHLYGRAGWVTVFERCHRQVGFFCEKMN
jgi:hypothetical protein